MNFEEYVRQELDDETNLYNKLNGELKTIPHGKLTVNASHGHQYFYVDNGKQVLKLGDIFADSKYKENKREIVSELSARRCIEKMMESLEYDQALLKRTLKKFKVYDPNQLIPTLNKAYSQITDGIFRHTGYIDYSIWDETTDDEDFRAEGRIHRTSSGLWVRSRAEVAIADTYSTRGLHYTYEKKLLLGDGTVLHPDFTVLIPGTDRVIYHEHVSMLDNSKYRESFLWKARKYIENGIYPNRDLLITTEEKDGSIDMKKLNKMIDLFLLQ